MAIPALYRKNHVDKADERLDLFRGLVERYGVASALYPGSFVHITPSLAIPRVTYVDSDRRARRFFADPEVLRFVRARRDYSAEPQIRFHAADYEDELDEPEGSYALLISQYAGFVSRACRRYVAAGGLLVVNNSHGDASMAALDPAWRLVGVYRRRGERFTFSEEELDTYMVRRKGGPVTVSELERTMRGPAFTRSAAGYIFERVA